MFRELFQITIAMSLGLMLIEAAPMPNTEFSCKGLDVEECRRAFTKYFKSHYEQAIIETTVDSLKLYDQVIREHMESLSPSDIETITKYEHILSDIGKSLQLNAKSDKTQAEQKFICKTFKTAIEMIRKLDNTKKYKTEMYPITDRMHRKIKNCWTIGYSEMEKHKRVLDAYPEFQELNEMFENHGRSFLEELRKLIRITNNFYETFGLKKFTEHDSIARLI